MNNERTMILRLKSATGGSAFSLSIPNYPHGTGETRVENHTFMSSALRNEAMEQARSCAVAYRNGETYRALRHLQEIHNIVLTDQAHRVVRMATGLGLHSKLFAVTDGPALSIRSQECSWGLQEISPNNYAIPTEILKGLGRLRDAGIHFDGLALATPYANAPSSRFLLVLGSLIRSVLEDPVLLGYKTGKNGYMLYLELGRWA